MINKIELYYELAHRDWTGLSSEEAKGSNRLFLGNELFVDSLVHKESKSGWKEATEALKTGTTIFPVQPPSPTLSVSLSPCDTTPV